MPAAGGRAARRRDAEASGRIDADSTEVLTGLHALREPVRGEPGRREPGRGESGRGDQARPAAPAPGPAEVTAVTRVHPPAGAPPRPSDASGDRDDPDDPHKFDEFDEFDERDELEEYEGADDLADERDENEPIGWAARLPHRPALAVIAVVAALGVVGVVAVVTSSDTPPTPTPAAVVDDTNSVVEPPAETPGPTPQEPLDVDPRSEEAVAFLTAMRDADIPTSRSGQAETEAAAALCQQLDQGADEAALVRTLPAVLPDLTRAQAAQVVDMAKKHYC